MHREVHNCSQGVSIKNYEPRIEKSDWSIQLVMVELYIYIYIYVYVCVHSSVLYAVNCHKKF